MQDGIVVIKFVVVPVQVILSLIVVEYRTIVVPAPLRPMVRLNIPISEVQRFERQPLERDIN